MIPAGCRGQWAECFGEVSDELARLIDDADSTPHTDIPFPVALERRVKMFFILPFLMLRKPPDPAVKTSMNQAIRARLASWRSRDFATLIADYESDVVFLATQAHPSAPSNNREAAYRHAVELIKLGQLKRARATVTSNGCSDPTLPHVQQ